MPLWYIGNTSVRSAFRLRDGLIALSQSNLQGQLRGRDGDRAFRRLLGEAGIVSLGQDITESVGRKWRSALGKMGFLYPEAPVNLGVSQKDIGPMDYITPNGQRLIASEAMAAIQECYLRSLAALYQEVTPGSGQWFSPLRYTLAVLLKMEEITGEASISFLEMAMVVQTTSAFDDLDNVCQQIISLRNERVAVERKRPFDSRKYAEAGSIYGKMGSTFKDYADANLRYLKTSGLLLNKGRGISLAPEKRLFAKLLATDITSTASPLARINDLCNGAELPTDNKVLALKVVNDLVSQVNGMGIRYSLSGRPMSTIQDISIIRHEIEDIIAKRKEEQYADEQAAQWLEIATYMEMLTPKSERKNERIRTGISIPREEMPAYFEWSVWRAFLAIDHLYNKPYDARRFKIDQDFLPVGTAPGNGPDLIMEFEEYVIVVEVTLTENSRQEAAEGEPVRRHIAELMVQYHEQKNKPVYGLFIANRIDTNTAETFKKGTWYTRNEEVVQLHIIPLTLSQFNAFFEKLFTTNHVNPDEILVLLKICDELKNDFDAPGWKKQIDIQVSKAVLID